MRRRLGFGCLAMLLLALLSLGALAGVNWREAARRDRPFVEPRLTAAEKAELAEALHLQRALGSAVWPGLSEAAIPVILFNDRYEFLVGAAPQPVPWVIVEGDDFLGEPYQRREAVRPQAFAVPIGERWAGSIGTLDRMNREYLLGVRRQLPSGLAQLFPYPWATLARDLHTVAVLHEVFHAYQASLAPARFAKARAVYALEARYPSADAGFAGAWDREGAALAAALRAASEEETRDSVREFLRVRDERRLRAGLGEELLAYERELEWLEGLAKYVEIRFHEQAAAHPEDPALGAYRPGLPHWQMEFRRLAGELGRQEGDFRFYLSGMGQARLLDRLRPGWQGQVLRDDVYLEALLRGAIGVAGGPRSPFPRREGGDGVRFKAFPRSPAA